MLPNAWPALVTILLLSLPASCAREATEAPDAGEPRTCSPRCHWDCTSGGFACVQGKVWRLGVGPRPCCQHGDPWPGPGPICSLDTPVRVCANDRCASATPRCPQVACEGDPALPCPDDGQTLDAVTPGP